MSKIVDPAFDQACMQQALALAEEAAQAGEVPIGAVLTKNKTIIAAARNRSIELSDPAAHAEILVLRQAGQILQNYRLVDCTLYVSLEPCPMCAGSLIHARLARLVYAAQDFRSGACGTVLNLLQHPALNHHIPCEQGLYGAESVALLQQFFQARRRNEGA